MMVQLGSGENVIFQVGYNPDIHCEGPVDYHYGDSDDDLGDV